MATKIDYYKNDGSAAIIEDDDAELWLAPAFTTAGGAIFMSITDLSSEFEAGILLPLPALKWIAGYFDTFIKTADSLTDGEEVPNGEE